MKLDIPGAAVRRPIVEDIAAVLELAVSCDIAEHGEPDTELDEIQTDWEAVDLEKDIWLVHNHEDVLIGYGKVSFEWEKFYIDFFTHPHLDTGDLARQLVQQCNSRAQEKLTEMKDADEKEAILYVSHVNENGRQAVETVGFKVKKLFYRMQIQITEAPASVEWPADTELRKFELDKHGKATHAFINQSFDWPGRTGKPSTYKNWSKFMTRPEIFIPEIWFLLFHQDEIIGAALCFEYPETGWIRQVGVKKSWRGKGLGKELMQHAFHTLYARGHEIVSLAVESDNPNAYEFYKAIGMYVERQHDEYTILIK
ncbi:MAG: GNAT family N-acetyltransferase [Chloroflexota bacterium]